LDINWFCQEF